jgi:hypothetical protein
LNPSARRRSLFLRHLLAESLCMILPCVAPALKGQSISQSAVSAVQPFDATNLREPVEMGTPGPVQAGDAAASANEPLTGLSSYSIL